MNRPSATVAARRAFVASVWSDPAVSVNRLCRDLGATRWMIYRDIKMAGLPPRSRGCSYRSVEEAVRELWNSTTTVGQIAAQYGCALSTVRRVARSLGFPARTPGRPRGEDVVDGVPSNVYAEDVADARDRWDAGKPVPEIADYLGWSEKKTRTALRGHPPYDAFRKAR